MFTLADQSRFLLSGVKTEFMKAYEQMKPIFPSFTTEIKSGKQAEIYARFGQNPQMKEWIDERAPKGLREFGFTIINKHYEASIAIDRDDLEDDQYGQILFRARTLAEATNKFYDRQAALTIQNGISTLAYDGQNFFDTDHLEGDSGTQINTATGASYQFSAAGIQRVANEMMLFKDDTGEFAGVNPTTVMVPVALQWKAKQLLDPVAVNITNSPADKVLSGVYNIIVNPYLPNNGDNSVWYMMDLSKAVRPIIYQNRRPVEFAALDKPTDYEAFVRRKNLYGVDSRFAFGYGDWRMAYRAAGA